MTSAADHLRCSLVIASLLALLTASPAPAAPHNVILFIGDGMGPEHMRAGGMYTHGAEGTLVFEAFPHTGTVNTASAGGRVTDSAAAATAMATGHKAYNGTLSQSPEGEPYETAMEFWQARGRAVGLVSTAYLTHATPAAFCAHEGSRESGHEIARDYLRDCLPGVMMGGGRYIREQAAREAGYRVVTDRAGLLALNTSAPGPVAGLFGHGHLPYEADGLGEMPALDDMVTVALDLLDNDPDGLFLMVEGGRIDHASHMNQSWRMVPEVAAFERAVRAGLKWAADHPDTLIIVTADHETGGLMVTSKRGEGEVPEVSWSSHDHTGVRVGIFATGPGSEAVSPEMENTDIHSLITLFSL